jgi:hypothetical protein
VKRLTLATVLCSAAFLLGFAVPGANLNAQQKQSASHNSIRPNELTGSIAKMAPFLGNWEIEAKWADGTPLWARNEYRVGIGGKFVEANTYSKDKEGNVYERYATVFGYDEKAKHYAAHGFTFDGSMKVTPFELSDDNGHLVYSSQWKVGEGDQATEFKQSVTFLDNDSYRWLVSSRKPNADWEPMMDGVWKRAGR